MRSYSRRKDNRISRVVAPCLSLSLSLSVGLSRARMVIISHGLRASARARVCAMLGPRETLLPPNIYEPLSRESLLLCNAEITGGSFALCAIQLSRGYRGIVQRRAKALTHIHTHTHTPKTSVRLPSAAFFVSPSTE